ncbi:hypothetical protein TH5_07825 [Thalassospira xianhensis MCCC 1A02616]|uniref:Uncharacterized protein n=1 Tax=Thalassospira xianhensis MCCC 1A02616 TaxID=1177929 RepID=A0A367UEE5_9PROT|nr:hypothetical protein TH5_07825 [Thalassospira xianhensis MCCC 1A02616]
MRAPASQLVLARAHARMVSAVLKTIPETAAGAKPPEADFQTDWCIHAGCTVTPIDTLKEI